MLGDRGLAQGGRSGNRHNHPHCFQGVETQNNTAEWEHMSLLPQAILGISDRSVSSASKKLAQCRRLELCAKRFSFVGFPEQGSQNSSQKVSIQLDCPIMALMSRRVEV